MSLCKILYYMLLKYCMSLCKTLFNILLQYYIISCTILTKHEGRHPNAECRPSPCLTNVSIMNANFQFVIQNAVFAFNFY